MAELREVSNQLKNYIATKEGLKAQYTVSEKETREITMENGEFSLFRTLFDNNVTIKVIHNQKIGSADINRFEEKALQDTVDVAITSAESAAQDEYYDIAPKMEPAVFCRGPQEPDIDKLMQRAVEFADDIRERHPKIQVMQLLFEYVRKHIFYRNTNGSEDETSFGYYIIVAEYAGNDGTESTGICDVNFVTENLDRPFIECNAMEQRLCDAENSLHPITIDGKFEGPVIFTPDAFQQMMTYAFGVFVGDQYLLSGESKWFGKLGEKVASDKLTVSISPWDERLIGTAVRTEDGFRTENYTLIENGVLKSYMDSLYVSKKCKLPRALSTDYDFVVTPGETSYADMLKGMDRGLVIGAIACGYPGANGEVAGVAKQSFYVENGKIQGAVNETMVSFNLADMFQNIEELSIETVSDGCIVMPYVKVGKVMISGK